MKITRVIPLLMVALCAFRVAHGNDLTDVKNPAVIYEHILGESFNTVERESDAARPFSDSTREARALILNNSQWQVFALNVCFWNGPETERDAVITSAERWNGIAQIRLNFRGLDRRSITCQTGDTSHIRISLAADATLKYASGQNPAGNWSLIGRQSTFVPIGGSRGQRYEVTMNLPEIGSLLRNPGGADMKTLDFQVGHEFGHALGLLHEFQSKVCDGWIDVKLLASDQGWNAADAAANLWPVTKLNISYTEGGAYDINSIMQYNLQKKYFIQKPGVKNPCWREHEVTTPSSQDFRTLAQIYGPDKASGVAELSQTVSPYRWILRESNSLRASLQNRFEFAQARSPQAASALKNYQSVLDDLESFSQGRLSASAGVLP